MMTSAISGNTTCWSVPAAEGLATNRGEKLNRLPSTSTLSVFAHKQFATLPLPTKLLRATSTPAGPSRRITPPAAAVFMPIQLPDIARLVQATLKLTPDPSVSTLLTLIAQLVQSCNVLAST